MPAILVESPRLVLRRVGSGTSLAGPMSARLSACSRDDVLLHLPAGRWRNQPGKVNDPGISTGGDRQRLCGIENLDRMRSRPGDERLACGQVGLFPWGSCIRRLPADRMQVPPVGSDIRKLHSMQKFSVMEVELLSRGGSREAPSCDRVEPSPSVIPAQSRDPAPEAASEALAELRPRAPGRAQEVEQGDHRCGGDRDDGRMG
jgi:hypothetical protein